MGFLGIIDEDVPCMYYLFFSLDIITARMESTVLMVDLTMHTQRHIPVPACVECQLMQQ